MAENAIISDLEFAPQLTDDMVVAVEDTQNTYSATLGMLRGQFNKIFVEKKDVDLNNLTDDGFYQIDGTLTNAPLSASMAWFVNVVKKDNVVVQMASSLDDANYKKTFIRRWNGTTWTAWEDVVEWRFKVVSALPSSPSSDIFYFVTN